MSIYTILRQFTTDCEPISLCGGDKKRMDELWDKMLSNGLLSSSGSTKYTDCPDPECAGNGEVQYHDNKPYVDCSSCLRLQGVGLEVLSKWQLSLKNVLEHIKDQLNLTNECFEIKRGEWQLGFYKGVKVVFSISPEALPDRSNVICLSFNGSKNVLELAQVFAFPFSCAVEKSIFDNSCSRIQGQGSETKEIPQYSFAGFEVYCETNPPYNTKNIKFKAEAIYGQYKSIRLPDWEVLHSLVKGRGSVVSRADLLQVLRGTRYDDEQGSDSELNAAISRLRNDLGVKIETAKKIGYSLSAEQTLRK